MLHALLLCFALADSTSNWHGASGQVRAVFARPGAEAQAAIDALAPKPKKLRRAAAKPGVYDLDRKTTLFTLVPFEAKRGRTRLGRYRMGLWPQETGGSPNGYAAPDGFLRLTKKDAQRRVSTHFRLWEFLTHDQAETWPKYAVLRAPLLDKLELTAQALKEYGRSDSIRILSGFRTPQYNAPGVGPGGRVEDSRHLYGDAADIFVSANGDSLMDDLDGDGQVTVDDARWLLFLVEQVEADHPELVGGLGLYPAAEDHGPFVHVDVRGKRARW